MLAGAAREQAEITSDGSPPRRCNPSSSLRSSANECDVPAPSKRALGLVDHAKIVRSQLHDDHVRDAAGQLIDESIERDVVRVCHARRRTALCVRRERERAMNAGWKLAL
jgi:hypothetical protein